MGRLYRALGLFFVGLGLVGSVVPILPTTPFLLLALWFFARSSPRLKEWLLSNRLCGRYLSDFYDGKGVPKRVKIYTLVLLWTTISISAFCLVEALWLRVLLFVVAVGVSVHILRFKTKRMSKKIVIIVPTEIEAEGFKGVFEGVEVVIGGVGMAEIAATTAGVVVRQKPDVVILAGIAGAYPDSGLTRGDCVLVESERVADLGAVREGAFVPLYQREYRCEYALRMVDVLPLVAGCTVSRAAGEAEMQGGAIENMEGAAFFAVCEALEVDFLEVRAVSNFTTDSRTEWDIDGARKALKSGLGIVIERIRV